MSSSSRHALEKKSSIPPMVKLRQGEPTIVILASHTAEAEKWLAIFQRNDIQADWMTYRRLAAGGGDQLQQQPELWLLLEADLLPAMKAAMARQQSGPGEAPVVLLLEPDDTHRVSDLMLAGAADVWYQDLPTPLLLRRLEMELQLRRQERILAKKLLYEGAVAECARLLVGRGPLGLHLQRALEILQTASGVSRAYVFRNHLDPVRGLCVTQVHESCAPGIEAQIDNPQLQDQPFARDAPNALALLASGEPFVGLVDDLPEPERELLSSQRILSVLILPIFCGEEFWGFIGFDDFEQPTPWHHDEIALLRIVAETTGLAIERQYAEDELYLLAVVDPLTGLHNRRHITQQLVNLVNQSLRENIHFSVALLDIDWFKRINDTFGHQGGDLVLRDFAKALKRSCRSYDLVGRYGGEEFMLSLLHADSDQLAQRLLRLRNELCTCPVQYQNDAIPMTFSAGIASTKELGGLLTVDALINLADRRLYEAKQQGRNCIVIGDLTPAI
ncbi:GGDEF domain-containing protein [Synechococcus sp. BA-132 BA5]|uniref:GGDEF domain-containing protein n=1 Tax=Synechococcus sp. BA-132 BA5 TaxID=3110252 RepID=UPI002B1ED58C|nr:sensor domain-containing diguanylate cyclase [Synechococcus sp. BA-132 BA5]MEA5416969.1 sensor domain-containing diguanylate cyclase [Synechococcus sp. BA-132 BA5]